MTRESVDGIELVSFGSPIDLLRTHTGGKEVTKLEVITVSGAATLTGKTKGSGDTARTFTVAAGTVIELPFRTIDSVSSVTRVRVFWGE